MHELWFAELNQLVEDVRWERLDAGESIGLALEPVCESREADFGLQLVEQLKAVLPDRIFEVTDAAAGSRYATLTRVS